MHDCFLLIPGRTAKQGCGISEGKLTEGYLAETTTVRMNPEDFARIGCQDGERVLLVSQAGEAQLRVVQARPDELPPGVLFLAYGDASSRLMGGDTHGSGMPTSKGIEVILRKLP